MTPQEALDYLAGPEPMPTGETRKSAEWKMYGSREAAAAERDRKIALRARAIRALQVCVDRCEGV